jgi:hypothetical protein
MLGKLVKGALQVVELLPLALCLLPVKSLEVFIVGLRSGDEKGIRSAPKVLRGDSTAPALGSVEVGSTVAINQTHGYYAPRRAPIPAKSRLMSLSSSRSSMSRR